MSRRQSRILVTGGAGFIGSSLCGKLAEIQNFIVCLDNFEGDYSASTKLQNIAALLDLPNFHLVQGDIRNESVLDDLFMEFEVDTVIHLAAKAGVRSSLSAPESYLDTNVMGTIRLLEAMRRHSVKRIIFASSSSVYGDREGMFSEEDRTDLQLSPYAVSKKTAEVLLYNYHRVHGFGVIILRLFSVYGPRQRPDLVIHKFVDAIFKGIPIEVYGDGQNARDFTHVDDVVEGFLSSLNVIREDGDGMFQTINLGSNRPVSILALIAELRHLMEEKEFKVNNVPAVAGEMRSTCAGLAKAMRLLGYVPKVGLNQGLTSFLDWYTVHYTENHRLKE